MQYDHDCWDVEEDEEEAIDPVLSGSDDSLHDNRPVIDNHLLKESDKGSREVIKVVGIVVVCSIAAACNIGIRWDQDIGEELHS